MKYLLYIGNSEPCPSSERYVLALEDESFERMKREQTFTGTVVAVGKKWTHPIGYTNFTWCNPVVEVKSNGWPVFVRVNIDWVREQKWYVVHHDPSYGLQEPYEKV